MRPNRSNLSAAFEMEVDTKWLTIDTKESPSKLRVRDEATASLSALGTDKLGLVMIHGTAKTGKSFLMNKLMGQPGLFAVRGGNTATTVGVDLSPIKSYAEFTGGRGGDGCKVAFVDVEGQGDRGVDYDVMLTAPLLLVSKATIFNWRGKMAKDEMLNKLGVLAQASRMVKPDGNAKGDYRIFGPFATYRQALAYVNGMMYFKQGWLLPATSTSSCGTSRTSRACTRRVIEWRCCTAF